jgi:hypothetical protein
VAGWALFQSAHGFYGISGAGAVAAHSQLKKLTSSVDIIIFMASLASDPRNVDSQLDVLRAMTATSTNLQQLSSIEQTQLKDAYLAIENYLIVKEPVREYTAGTIRQYIDQAIPDAAKPQTFWPMVKS